MGPKYKIARRLGPIFSKTQTNRFAMVEGKKKANIAKGKKHRNVITEYGLQLLEKQKVRYSYGLTERQLSNYVAKARARTGGIPAAEMFRFLESRLDNVVYRSGFVPTRQFARQAIVHGHIMVNGKKVNSPSYEMRIGDTLSIRPQSVANGIFRNIFETLKEYRTPDWLVLDKDKLAASLSGLPAPAKQASDLNFALVVQFYSRV